MPDFRICKQVCHCRDHMFALVSDVERYPEFLPMCEGLTIRSRCKYGKKIFLVADMHVGYKLVHEAFTTQVCLQPQEYCIDVQYIDGPFRNLENRWLFLPVEGDDHSCFIDFFICYEFKSQIFAAMTGAIFDLAFRKFTDAFEKRADEVYGKSG